MTTDEIFAWFQATCDLHSRDLAPNVPLPASLQPRPHLRIADVHKFAVTNLTRLHAGSSPLKILAGRSLRALIEQLKTN